MKCTVLLLFAMIFSSYGDDRVRSKRRYKPHWKDLDSRPLPEWYDRAKIGIFLHWGVYSVPATGFGSEWFWIRLSQGNKKAKKFMELNYPPGFQYWNFAPSFTADRFNPKQWADLFKKAGAKYVVLTSKHHDGFKLFPSKHNVFPRWNAVEVGPRRDLVKDLSKAVRKKGLEFGVYYSLLEWFNPVFLSDEAKYFATRKYASGQVRPDIEQLVNDYRPALIWSDGDHVAPDTFWNSTGILAWLYNDSPVKDKIVVNDRWGIGTNGKHGDFYNYADYYNPGKLQKHKWESAFTIDELSWGFRRSMELIGYILTLEEIISNVVKAVSCGGNALINVGPMKDGTIHETFKKLLLKLGKWLNINGEAIYNTSPWLRQTDSAKGEVWYTCRKTKYNAKNPTAPPKRTDDVTAIYAIILRWPQKNTLNLKRLTSTLLKGYYYIEMLGLRKPLKWTLKNGRMVIVLPLKAKKLSKEAWTLKFTGNNFTIK